MASSSSTASGDLAALERIYERVTTTSNDDLSGVLNKLLPKLVPLMNKDLLRPTVLKVLSNVTKRVRLLGTRLPIPELISIVTPEFKPFAVNFAIVLIDVSILNEQAPEDLNRAFEVLIRTSHSVFTTEDKNHNQNDRDRFNSLENSLFHYFGYLAMKALPTVDHYQSDGDNCWNTVLIHYISDWYLDVCLVPSPNKSISTNTVAASPSSSSSSSSLPTIILPGLSTQRLDRLREKSTTPINIMNILIAQKQYIISHVLYNPRLISPYVSILAAVICQHDNDGEVSRSAMFKLNGMRNYLHSNFDEEKIVHILRILFKFLSWKSNDMDREQFDMFTNFGVNLSALYFQCRTGFSDDTRAEVLHWIVKEMSEYLDDLCSSIRMFVSSLLTQSSTSTSSSHSAKLMMKTSLLLEKLSECKKMGGQTQENAATIVQLCMTLLSKFSYSSSLHDDMDARMRISAYGCIENLVGKYPSCVDGMFFEVADLLFKLLDKEIHDMTPRLLGAIGALRLAYTISSLSSSSLHLINDVIMRSRVSAESRKRVTAIEWVTTIFGLKHIKTVETLLMLVDDLTESVRNTAKQKMVLLIGAISSILNSSGKKNDEDVQFIDEILRNFTSFSNDVLFDQQSKILVRPIGLILLLQLSSSCLEVMLGFPVKMIDTTSSFITNSSTKWMNVCKQMGMQSDGTTSRNETLLYILNTICEYDFSSKIAAHSSLSGGAVRLIQMCLLLTTDESVRHAGRRLQPTLLFFIGKCDIETNARIASVMSLLNVFAVEASVDAAVDLNRILEHKILAALDKSNDDEDGDGDLYGDTVPRLSDEDCEVLKGSIVCLSALASALFASAFNDMTIRALSEVETRLLMDIIRRVYSTLTFSIDHDLYDLTGTCLDSMKNIFSEDIRIFLPSEEPSSCVTLRSMGVDKQNTALKRAEWNIDTIYQKICNMSTQNQLQPLCCGFSVEAFETTLTALFNADKASNILTGTPSQESTRRAEAVTDNNQWCSSVCKAIECYSFTIISSAPVCLHNSWYARLLVPHLLHTQSPNIAFALAEGICRISFLRIDCPLSSPSSSLSPSLSLSWGQSTPIQQHIQALIQLNIMEYENTNENLQTNQCSERFAIVLLLVYFIFKSRNMLNTDDNCLSLIPSKTVVNVANVLLMYLLSKDAFVQDMATLGLCHAYAYCKAIDDADDTDIVRNPTADVIVSYATAASAISKNVIACITKERRTLQPVGFSVNPEQRARQQQQTMLAALTTTDVLSSLETSDNADLARVAREMRESQRENEGPAGETGGGNTQGESSRERRGDNFNQGSQPQVNAHGVHAEVCRIAKKSGDGSTVFKFLSIVKCDQSFGVGISAPIMERYAAPEVTIEDSKLNTMIPLLFQAKYHPSASVKNVMKGLWHTLVTLRPSIVSAETSTDEGLNEESIMQQQQDNIMKTLITSLSSIAWKDREAAALALEAFLPSKSWQEMVEPNLSELWELSLRLLDDIQPSTVLAAVKLTKVVLDHILRACNPEESDKSIIQRCTDLILPLILDRGLTNATPEVRGFSLGALIKIINVCKRSLGKWMESIISILVESMSALEPRTLQYMSFHTARLQISEEELESFRLKMSQESPMQNALDSCLQSLDIKTVPVVARNLCSNLRSGVGLATRVSAAKALSYLAEKYPGALGPHATSAFKSLLSFLVAQTRLDSLRKTVLSTVGTLARIIPELELEESCASLCKSYKDLFHPNKGSLESVSGCDVDCAIAGVFRQLSSRSGDRIVDQTLWGEILTCAYIGSFDGLTASDIATGESVLNVQFATANDQGVAGASKADWTRVWADALTSSGIGNKQQALRKIVSPVLEIVVQLLKGKTWTGRAQGLSILLDIINSTDLSLVSLYAGEALLIALSLLPGRIWKGQELTLEILTTVFKKLPSKILLRGDRESRKDNFDTILSRTGEWSTLEAGYSTRIEQILYSDFKPKLQDTEPSSSPLSSDLKINDGDVSANRDSFCGDQEKFAALSASSSSPPRLSHEFSTLLLINDEETNPDDEIHVERYTFSNWHLHGEGLWSFLLHEATRGDRQYKLAVVRTLSAYLFTQSQAPLYNEVLPKMLTLIGNQIKVYKIESNEFSGSAVSSHDDIATTNAAKKNISTTTLSTGGHGSAYKKPSASQKFGSRYGDLSKAKVTSSITSSSSLGKRVLSGVAHRGIASKATSDPVSSTSQSTSSTLSAKPEVCIPKADEVYISFIAPSSSMLVNIDPAFKVKLVECITNGFNKNISIPIESNGAFGLDNLSVAFVRYAYDLFTLNDLWSMRRAALLLTKKVMAIYASLENVEISGSCTNTVGNDNALVIIQIVLLMILRGAEDSKSYQVRVASLECLNTLLQVKSFVSCLSSHKSSSDPSLLIANAAELCSKIDAVFAVVRNDKKPEVISEAGNALKSWKLLNLVT